MKIRININTNENGYTLIELMISIVLFLVVISMVYQVMKIAIVQRNTINTKVDATKGARIAMNYIRRDVINAGLSYHNIGGLVPDNYIHTIINAPLDTDNQQDLLTGLIAGNNVSSNILNTGNQMDAIGIISRDFSFNNSSVVNFTGTSASGSSVLVTTVPGGTVNCNQYDLYMFETGTSQIIGLVTGVNNSTNTLTLAFGASDPLGINLAANGTGTAKSILIGTNISGTLKRITLTLYLVSSNGTLIRRTFGNQASQPASSQINSSELIYNVQDFQIKYLLDNGTLTDDPSLGNSGRANQQNMNRVVEVQVLLTVIQDDNSLPESKSPILIKEVISTRNLHYILG